MGDACLAGDSGSDRYAAGEALGAEITELCAHLYAAEYRLLVKIREFDNEGYWQLPGLYSCAHWLNFQCGIGINAAREKVRVAHALADLPKISKAFERGALSYSKVRAVTRVANADNEDFLLMIAKHGTAYHVEKLVSKYRRAKRQQDPENSDRQHRERSLRWYYDDDGSLVIRGRLPADEGELVVKALQMALERDAGDKDEISEVSAETPRPEVSAETPEDTDYREEPIAARRADALAEIAEAWMSSGPVPNASADRYQVVVHVSAETSHIDGGPHVSAETAARVACDCSLLAIREYPTGEPLSIGRRSRTIPPALRRALWLRDGGCRFPGCTRLRSCDGHHIRHWAQGGETSLGNLVLLCRFHHRLVHEGGFSCEKRPDGEVVFLDERESPLPHFSLLPRRNEEIEAVDALYRKFEDLGIDEKTCVPKWYAGDTMDWQAAVSAMFR